MTDAWGIEETYEDAWGRRHIVSDATVAALRDAIGFPGSEPGPLIVHAGQTPPVGPCELVLEDGSRHELSDRLPPDLPLGYHQLVDGDGERRLVVSPGRCHLLPAWRAWGWATQLYALRSDTSWGMGDFGDLEKLAKWSRSGGAAMLLVNPMPAVSPTCPQQPSPYYPSSRRFLNPIYLRVEEVPGATLLGPRLEEAATAGQALNHKPLIDRDAVWRLKVAILDEIWWNTPPDPGFETWRASVGPGLETFAVWCVLAETHGGDWRLWPARYRHPANTEVARIGEDDRVRFHQWLQWQCRRQLDRSANQMMLVQDLPIGFDPGGADAWAYQDLLALDVTVGAPPDEFNTGGQDWGLPPFVPHRLRAAGYDPFIQTIRASLAPGGGLRIDHVMGLFRLFWIPAGATPAEGGYVHYPSSDLLDVIALESTRAQAVVVGEDLGTVAAGTREVLAERRMLSYRLLWFEQEEPESWPALSMASITTHDLATVAGLWTGADLDEQESLAMAPNVESTRRIRRRVADLTGLEDDASTTEVVEEVHRHLAQAPSRLVCATLEDLTRQSRRPNIPGSVRPNWRLPLPQTLEEIMADPLGDKLADIFNRAVTDDEHDRT